MLSLYSVRAKQTLGLSREHERDDGCARGVQGPATMFTRMEWTTGASSSWAEMRLGHNQGA